MTVFAQVVAKDLGDSMRKYQSGSSSDFVHILIMVVSLAVFVILAWRLVLYRRGRMQPLMLFYDLCALHDVPRAIQRKMLQFARSHGVQDAAYFFVCPELAQRIRSAELAHAASQKEADRLKAVFDGFIDAAYGGGALENPAAVGGA
jgi:hypothetical protein